MPPRLREPAYDDRRRGPTGPGRWSRFMMVCAVLPLASCDFVARTFGAEPTSAHAEYAEGLADAGLAATPVARTWVAASERALEEAEAVTLPALRAGWFDVDVPSAVAVRFAPPDRRWVTVRARVSGDDRTRLFIDAFRMPAAADGEPAVLASVGDTTHAVSFRVRGPEQIVVRIQPELLRGGAWELQVTATDEEPVEGETIVMGGER